MRIEADLGDLAGETAKTTIESNSFDRSRCRMRLSFLPSLVLRLERARFMHTTEAELLG